MYSIWLADLIGVSSSNKSVHGLCALPLFHILLIIEKKHEKLCALLFQSIFTGLRYTETIHSIFTDT